VGVVKTIVLIFPMCFIDRFGRRPIILISVFGQFLTVLFLATSIGYINNGEITLTALCLYVGTFSLGLSTE